MARLLEFILFAVVAYFVFKTLNRLFSSSPNKNNYSSKPRQTHTHKKAKTKSQLKNELNWDAETIDYEEVKNNENKNNENK